MTDRSTGPAGISPPPPAPPGLLASLPGSAPPAELWRIVFEQAPFSTVVYDAAGHLLAVNAAFQAFWGVSQDTAPPGYSVLGDGELERQGVLPLIRRAFAGEAVTTPPVRYDISRVSVTGEGRAVWTQAHLYPIRDAAGRVTNVVLTHLDLSDRIAAEQALRASEQRFAAIVQQAAAGIAQVDLSGRFTLVNDRYCELLGRSRAELMGLHMQDVTHPDDLPHNRRLFTEAVERGTPFVIEKRYVRADGTPVWVSNSVAAIRGLSGKTESVLAVAFEVSDRRRAMEHLQMLALAGEVLSSSLDYRTTLRNVAELVVPAFARWSIVLLQDEAGTLSPVATASAACEKAEAAERLAHRIAEAPTSEHHLVRAVIRTGQPELVRDLTAERLAAMSSDPECRRLLELLDPASLLVVPLLVRERSLGALVCGTDDAAQRFDDSDLTFAAELARRAAAAVDNARLYAAEQAARLAAERAAYRSRQLQVVAAAFNEATTPGQVAELGVQYGLSALDAQAGSLGLLVDRGAALEIVHSAGFAADVVEQWRRFPLFPGKPLSDAVIRRTPILLGTREEWTARYPRARADLESMSMGALATVPLIIGGRALGGLTFTYREERSFDEADRTFLVTLGEQAAQALERARLFEAEHRARTAAERLQGLTLALSGALSIGEVGEAVMQQGVAALGADAGVLSLITAEGEELEIAASIGYAPDACMGPGRRWPTATTIPIAEAARTGTSVIIPSPQVWADRYLGGYMPRQSASAAWAAFPLVLEGRTSGALLWTFHQTRAFDAEDVALMETVARQCSQALERVHLLQAERKARADAEAANRAKTEFLSAMSHELRTPLNAIVGYVDLLEVGVHGPLTDAQRADLARIRNAQAVLLGLISDILNFARIEAGRIEFNIEPVALDPLLAEIEGMVDPQLRARELRYHRESDLRALRVLGDRERIRQILMNLLSNALKFTEPGGRIEVRTEIEADRVMVRVSDTGRGIPRDKLEAIFNPFVQVDRYGAAESQQGVGLGLAISRELARSMAGELSVESTVGAGSSFILQLPVAD